MIMFINCSILDLLKKSSKIEAPALQEQSLGELNLSFSTGEINTFKYKESTIEDALNELNNLNSINDSEIKLTFGHENAQNNYYQNNYDISATEGRILNDITFHKYNFTNV